MKNIITEIKELKCRIKKLQNIVDNMTISNGELWEKVILNGKTAIIPIINPNQDSYEIYFETNQKNNDLIYPNYKVTTDSIIIETDFSMNNIVCYYRKIRVL